MMKTLLELLNEGAISISLNMSEFATKSFIELKENIIKFQGNYDVIKRNLNDKILNYGVVNNNKFGDAKIICKVIISDDLSAGGTDFDKNIIRIIVTKNEITSIFKKTKNYETVKDNIIKTIKHE